MRLLRGSRAVGLLGAAVVALGCACCAAGASADPIGQVMKGPDTNAVNDHVPWAVQATLSGNTVTVTNPQVNAGLSDNSGDPGIITSVDLNGPGAYGGNGGNGGNGLTPNGSFTANEPFTVNSPSSLNSCYVVDDINAHCDFADYRSQNASNGLQPGQSATITYPTNAPGSLWSVSVNFDYDDLYLRCRPDGAGSDLAFRWDFSELASAVAGGYASNCAPPSKVRITAMHIDNAKHTASFHQTASGGAHSFGCELIRNGRVMFDHTCGASKAYSKRLPSGHYVYEVWGVNKSGVSADFAVARFTIP
jgi:hypothetical protein